MSTQTAAPVTQPNAFLYGTSLTDESIDGVIVYEINGKLLSTAFNARAADESWILSAETATSLTTSRDADGWHAEVAGRGRFSGGKYNEEPCLISYKALITPSGVQEAEISIYDIATGQPLDVGDLTVSHDYLMIGVGSATSASLKPAV